MKKNQVYKLYKLLKNKILKLFQYKIVLAHADKIGS